MGCEGAGVTEQRCDGVESRVLGQLSVEIKTY